MNDRKDTVEHLNGLSVARLNTGPGSGLICDACQQTIEPSHIECRTPGRGEQAHPLRFHQWCYYARFASNR